MFPANAIRRHLEEICSAMRDHRRVWEEVMARPSTRHEGNAAAYAAARPHKVRMEQAWSLLAAHIPEELPHESPDTLEAWLRLCEVDVPAFRIGYLKERVYRSLKQVSLSPTQRDRVLRLALHHLGAPQWRREWRQLSRLAVRLATPAFLDAVEHVWVNTRTDQDRVKVGLFIGALLQRRDLRPHRPEGWADVPQQVDRIRKDYWDQVLLPRYQRTGWA